MSRRLRLRLTPSGTKQDKSSRSELISLAAKVDSSALKVALMDFAIGTGNMALDFLNNPRAKGTSGITEFNDTFKVVIDLCKDAGWEY